MPFPPTLTTHALLVYDTSKISCRLIQSLREKLRRCEPFPFIRVPTHNSLILTAL